MSNLFHSKFIVLHLSDLEPSTRCDIKKNKRPTPQIAVAEFFAMQPVLHFSPCRGKFSPIFF